MGMDGYLVVRWNINYETVALLSFQRCPELHLTTRPKKHLLFILTGNVHGASGKSRFVIKESCISHVASIL